MSHHVARRLRPYLFHAFARSQRAGVPRLLSSSVRVCQAPKQAPKSQEVSRKEVTHDYEKRLAQLEAYKPREEWHPRLPAETSSQKIPIKDFIEQYNSLANGESHSSSTVTLLGRVHSMRSAGSKLHFLTVTEGPHTLQALVQLKTLPEHPTTLPSLKSFAKTSRKGDWFLFTGVPHRTPAGELSLSATRLPTLMSPSLHQIPTTLEDATTRATSRHIAMLSDPSSTVQVLRARHTIERTLTSFLDSRDFVSVRTPILQAGAGGAVARPFETIATEMPDETLNLRIAPELWLKRLVVGGLPRVYEIGPVFRNEGVDATHNPEFTIAEFYAAGASLQDLMAWTQDLLREIAAALQSSVADPKALPEMNFEQPFQVLEFLPTLESQIARPLPPLDSPTSHADLLSLFTSLSVPVPSSPTIPRLLDHLAAVYLEPLTTAVPTFITHHPAPLSPLSKTYTCPRTSQPISARAELYVDGKEIANMYEEENSPFIQRRKFEAQLQFREVDGEGDGRKGVDEGYLGALEWGLPPTGGWGCGVERLVGVMLGGKRVGEVLAFGGVRNVVAAGRG